METTKKRVQRLWPPVGQAGHLATNRTYNRRSNEDLVSSTSPYFVNGRQTTVSEGHPWRSINSSNTRDIGGPFWTTKHEFEDVSGNILQSASYDTLAYRSTFTGPFFIRAYSVSKPDRISSLPANDRAISKSQLEAHGTTAIARTIPTKSQASLSVALGELIRDGIPIPIIPGKVLKEKDYRLEKNPKDSAEEWLNFNFGISPMISDIKATARAVKNSERILKQLKRDQGRLVRRQMTFPQSIETKSTTETGVTPANVEPPFFSQLGTRYTEERWTRSMWFSAGYTYFFSEFLDERLSEFEKYRKYADKILGLNVTPETIWNLTPWSWFVDWNSNVGDIVTNLSYIGKDGLVLRYGYIMCTDVYTRTDTLSGLVDKTGRSIPPLTQRVTSVTKRRERATPYGFGANVGQFSAKQWSILAALGITQGSRTAW